MGSFSIAHWLIVLVVLLLLFGPKKISELGKGLGQGIKNFKTGLAEDDAPPDASKKNQGELSSGGDSPPAGRKDPARSDSA